MISGKIPALWLNLRRWMEFLPIYMTVKQKKIEFRLFSAYRDRGGEDRKVQNSGALYKFYSA